MKGFIVYPDYIVENNRTIVRLFGRLENGQSFLTIHNFDPYFFIRSSDLNKVKPLLSKFKTEKTNLKNFKGDDVIKISSSLHTELNKLVSAIHEKSIDTYEADIKPHFKFTIDNDLSGSITISGNAQSSDRIDCIYNNPDIKKTDFNPKLKVLSIDTETDKHSGKLFCIGMYGENLKKNFMITSKDLKNTVKCKDEIDCLEKFKAELLKYDPDIITGWNLIDFDLSFLQSVAKKNKIPFDIGRTDENPRLRIESNFFKSSTADIPGRQILDALYLVRDPFIQEAPSIKHAEFESYTLEDVSQAILGSGKLIKGKNRHEEIESLFKSDSITQLQKLSDYNLLDCQLAYQILEKANLVELTVERSQLTGMPLDRVTSSIANFDSLYIRNARSRGLVSPTTRYTQKEERIKGGYVFSSNPGIYRNVLILDFKSLYPSIIKTFNIDPSSFLDKKEKNAIESPNKAYFKNSHGVLPQIIEVLHQKRELAKKEKRELSSYAIKIIMNSFFGVLANPNCRYFSLQLANAITHFGQMIIQLTGKEIEKLGHKVIYMDTDSVFVETHMKKDKANVLGKEIESHINNFYKDYVKKHYNRESYLELQFQKQYLAFMIPKIRAPIKKSEEPSKESSGAAKKRYAGLLEKNGKEELEITGLEAIRGDWVEAAQEFQKELLMKLFHDEKVEKFIQEYIKKIKEGKLDKQLVYRKSIRKNLAEYTKTTPPHVKAARQLDKLDSNIIEYYITVDGPQPIQKLRSKIDYEHYIEKQIAPIANQILSLFNKDFQQIIEKAKQSTLSF